MVRSPDLSIPQMEALQLLLKVDYTRKVRGQLQWMCTPSPDMEATLVSIVRLTDEYNDRLTPLTVGMAIAEAEKGHTRMLLSEKRFDHYSRLANLMLDAKDFPGVPPQTLEETVPELQLAQGELRLAFKNAAYINPHDAPSAWN